MRVSLAVNRVTSSLSLVRVADAVALVAGCAMPLGFAPFGWYPIPVIALALLFQGWRKTSPARAFWRGWLFGLGMFGFGVSWVAHSFQFNHIALPVAIALTCLMVAILACYPALVGYLSSRFFSGGERHRLLLLLPAAWVFGEWVRGWFFTGFTWLQLGYSQVDSPLAGMFPVIGIYGVSWLVALSAGVVLLAVVRRGAWWRYLPLLAVVWFVARFVGFVQWVEPYGRPVNAALIQGNIPQDKKWLPEQRLPTVERYLALSRAQWDDADLVVWPETALPGYYHAFKPFLAELSREALQHRTDVLLGLPVVEQASSRRFFNAIAALGSHEGLYYKRHLVPFGEYLPLDAVLRPIVDLTGIPVANFTPGPTRQTLLEVAGHKVGLSICYEVAFGHEIIRDLPEAGLLVTVSNDAWFGDSIAPHQHLEIARTRALESGRMMLRATNTGISAIIGVDGRIITRSAQFKEEVLTGRITAMKGLTPYARVGDWPTVAGLLLVLGGAWLSARRRS